MKTMIQLVLAAIMIITFAACGDKSAMTDQARFQTLVPTLKKETYFPTDEEVTLLFKAFSKEKMAWTESDVEALNMSRYYLAGAFDYLDDLGALNSEVSFCDVKSQGQAGQSHAKKLINLLDSRLDKLTPTNRIVYKLVRANVYRTMGTLNKYLIATDASITDKATAFDFGIIDEFINAASPLIGRFL